MPYGQIVNQFIPFLPSDRIRSGGLDAFRSLPAGLMQSGAVFIVTLLALAVSIALIFQDAATGMRDSRAYRSLQRSELHCLRDFDLSGFHKHETLRHRSPFSDDVPEFVYKDYCHVPVL